MTRGKLVDVIDIHKYKTPNHPRGTYSYFVTLACGCILRRKGSTPIPKRCFCIGMGQCRFSNATN